ncbi:phage major capsid protein [Dietzia sp. SLG510A3-30A2]|nr:phage major capsid protein [Dietzia sp. SLG510A3-30A2]
MNPHEQLKAALARVGELRKKSGTYSDAEIREINALDSQITTLRQQVASNDSAVKALASIADSPVTDEGDEYTDGPSGLSGAALFGVDAKRLAMTDDRMQKVGAELARKAFAYSGNVGSKAGLSVSGSVSTPLLDSSGNIAIATQGTPPNTLLETLPMAEVVGGQIEYLRQGPRSSAATVVPAGELKPTTDMQLELVQAKLKVIAHISKADRFLLRDIGSAAAFFGNELALGVRDAVENRVLNGAGGTSDIAGILTTTGVKQQLHDTDVLTTIRQGLLQLELGGYIPSVIVLNPSDWASLELQRNTSGQFDLRPGETPINSVERRLWGAQVVCSRFLTAGQAVIIGQNTVGIFMDKTTGIEGKWAEEASDAFERNQVVGRAEGRFEVATYRPDGVVIADLTAA